MIKPMKARDYIEDKIIYPCYIQAKTDGVRALNIDGKLLARTLKPQANKYITSIFSKPELSGLDGEMYLTELGDNHKDLCRLTSGALRRIEGESEITWKVFDYVTEETRNKPYHERLSLLIDKVDKINQDFPYLKIEVVKTYFIESKEKFEYYDDLFLSEGYEGSMLKNPNAVHKEGRSDKNQQCWRVKRFIEEEILVTGLVEGNSNQNEAKINELGHTERSTHKENLVPNGQVGGILGDLLKDIIDTNSKEILIKKGTEILVSPGELTIAEREYFWNNQSEIIGKVVKFKMFPKNIKDLPRFPTFVTIREDFEE